MCNAPGALEDATRATRFALEHAARLAFIAMVSSLRHHLHQYIPPEALSQLIDRVEALGTRRKELEAAAIAKWANEDPFPGRW